VHIDECDYGSAVDSLMCEVWRFLCECPLVSTVLYSATPEELLFIDKYSEYDIFADLASQCNIRVEYVPPSGYCGPKRFLDAELVHEATPFFVARERGVLMRTTKTSMYSDDTE